MQSATSNFELTLQTLKRALRFSNSSIASERIERNKAMRIPGIASALPVVQPCWKTNQNALSAAGRTPTPSDVVGKSRQPSQLIMAADWGWSYLIQLHHDHEERHFHAWPD